MSALKLWSVAVQHPETREIITFIGQGRSIADAMSEGAKNLAERFRPDQSGVAGRPGEKGGLTRCAVYGRNGALVWKTLAEFEAGQPPTDHYDSPEAKKEAA